VSGEAGEDAGSRPWSVRSDAGMRLAEIASHGCLNHAGKDISQCFDRHADEAEFMQNTPSNPICGVLRGQLNYCPFFAVRWARRKSIRFSQMLRRLRRRDHGLYGRAATEQVGSAVAPAGEEASTQPNRSSMSIEPLMSTIADPLPPTLREPECGEEQSIPSPNPSCIPKHDPVQFFLNSSALIR
jgi:hypothetical protein